MDSVNVLLDSDDLIIIEKQKDLPVMPASPELGEAYYSPASEQVQILDVRDAMEAGNNPKLSSTREDRKEKRNFVEFVLTSMLPTYIGIVVALHFLLRKTGSEVVPRYGLFVLGFLVCIMGPGFAIAYGAMKISVILSGRIGNWTRYLLAALAAFLFSWIICYLLSVIFI
jgi:hypothetical protein